MDMKKAKGLIAVAVVVLMLVFGAATVYAVSADRGKADVEGPDVTADYAAEEMAVGAYYEDWAPEMDPV